MSQYVNYNVVTSKQKPEKGGSKMKYDMVTLGYVILLASGLAVYPLSGCSAEDLADPPEIGEIFPNFELPDLDGETHTLEQYRDKVVVIEMTSHHCPWVRGAEPHIIELTEKYADEDVVFVSINSHESETIAEIKEHVEKIEKPVITLKDDGNKYADVLGARVTPEMYVIDGEGKLVYHGAFDNRSSPEAKGDEAYTDNAIQAALAGEAADPARVRAWGCTIKRQ